MYAKAGASLCESFIQKDKIDNYVAVCRISIATSAILNY
jgi:hypothetical protein